MPAGASTFFFTFFCCKETHFVRILFICWSLANNTNNNIYHTCHSCAVLVFFCIFHFYFDFKFKCIWKIQLKLNAFLFDLERISSVLKVSWNILFLFCEMSYVCMFLLLLRCHLPLLGRSINLSSNFYEFI